MSFPYFNYTFEIGFALLLAIIFWAVLLKIRKTRNIHIRDASLTVEELEDHARNMGLEHAVTSKTNILNWPLTRMNDNYSYILRVYKGLNDDVMAKRTVPPAAEWLLDNFYIIEEQVKSIRQDLSKKEYFGLPVLKNGPYKGYTRIFAIALELVAQIDGQIGESTLLKYLKAYQSHNILFEREICIIPTVIRLALIEKIRILSEKIEETQKQWNLADKIVEEWLSEDSVELENIVKLFENNKAAIDEANPSFVEHLFYRLRRSGRRYSDVLRYIDENLDKFNTTAEIIAQKEHNKQAVSTVSMGNCIVSLKYVSNLNWVDVFESTSFLEKILRQDPDRTYTLMDTNSRNYYRRQIAKLAKAYGVSELQIAREAIGLAQEAYVENINRKDDENKYSRRAHVGYYLVGKGVRKLESGQLEKRTFFRKIIHSVKNNPALIYMGSISALTMLVLIFPINYALKFLDANYLFYAVIAGLAVLIPASEMVISIVNWLVCKVTKPVVFPRLELKDGVLDAMSTMVVIPALLPDAKRVTELLGNMENHYLANTEDNLYFALIGAFQDAAESSKDEDESVLLEAFEGIKALNKKYAKEEQDIFFFYNRCRKYNAGDDLWTGWERKRGALIELNDMLLGSDETSFSFYSNTSIPTHIKYIITLDADTVLPLGMAKKMIGTMAHPLNMPVIDHRKGIVTEGHGLMQPRISFDMDSSNRSIFSRIYTGQEGIDPYASAISDVYQDLFGEGIFTGKGIYDLRVFQSILKEAVPDNAILSHDLLEGSYVRAALVTDLELVDSYPSKYNSYMTRLYRWIRGDWQLIPWLRSNVNDRNNRLIKNPLSFISIWKIGDNLRRSLLAPSIMVLIFLGFSVLPGSSCFWTGFGIAALLVTFGISLWEQMFAGGLKSDKIKRHIPGFFGLKAAFYQFLLAIIFLPYQAKRALDAIVVTLVRVLITKKNMLEWVTSADADKYQSSSLKSYLSAMSISVIQGFALAVLAYFFKPESLHLSLVFLVIWGVSPFIAYVISKDINIEQEKLGQEALLELGKITRKTWRYFEEFANAKNNFLAPDNFQEDPPRGIAYRTSPTNIGLGLLASLSGRDMGYTGILETFEAISKTVTTIEKMEKWNGHLYNWYDTRTLEPLKPLYVSSVDSGNFVCYLITLAQGLKEYYSRPLVDAVFVKGINDTLRNGLQEAEELPGFSCFDFVKNESDINPMSWNQALDEFIEGTVVTHIKKPAWKTKVERMAEIFKKELEIFVPWVYMTETMPEDMLSEGLLVETNKLLDILKTNVCLKDLAEFNSRVLTRIDQLLEETEKMEGVSFQEGLAWLHELRNAVIESNDYTLEFLEKYYQLIERIDVLSQDTKFTFLYDQRRQLFSIGYSINDKKLTNSYYDLLASEARQTSYIAIARGEVPPKHWFMLGRALTVVDHYKGLISWSGTMFEYLMPLVIMRSYRNTLLDETYSFVIKSQKKYGKQRGMPWGSSESSFNLMDINLDYQYKAIGVPWLGLKRGLIEDAVTAPYATFLALMVNPGDAYKNIQYLKAEGLDGPYGYYEAADYTPERLGSQSERVVIRSFMAHHQGMSLLALNNYLNKYTMQKRFSRDPYVKAARLLLQEKVPLNVVFTKENKEKVIPRQGMVYEDKAAHRRFRAPSLGLPKAHILSNGLYSVMLTDKGTGYSRSKTVDISRWRQDPILDNYGMFFYIKNIDKNQKWSAAYAPLQVLPDNYEVVFSPDKATYRRTDGDIETFTEVAVASGEIAEIRRVRLKNNGTTPCVIEVTSYFEPVLAPQECDLAHPAFSNLFVRTEFNSEYKALLANRRPRSPAEKGMWIAEIPVIDGEMVGDIQYETDRMNFIGRGHTLNNPTIIERDKPLSNTVGAVLDPIFSLRARVKIEPGKAARISFVTTMADNKKSLMELVEKYSKVETCDAAFWLAITRSQVETKYLNIKESQMELYQEMISHILFISPLRVRHQQLIKENRIGQSSLWPYAISGDRPIILLILNNIEEVEILYEVLKAHEYWRLKDLRVDLVILCKEENSYTNPLFSLIKEVVYSSQTHDVLSSCGDVFILNTNNMLTQEINLFSATARMTFNGQDGTMEEQIKNVSSIELPPLRDTVEKDSNDDLFTESKDEPLEQRLFPEPTADEKELSYFNGLGGFDREGKEYVIRLEQGQTTPAPWANVIANPEFGFMVTESGGGFTWCENSRENKLSPWSNNPVIDNPGEIFYLSDKSGKPWSITPLPIREEEAYTIKHGFGYSEFEHVSHGISQSLVQFVPVEGTVKISIISLRNNSPTARDLNITYYVSPVLGVNTQETARHLVSAKTNRGTLIIENPYNREFADRVCFMDTSIEERSITGDRKEFFGKGKIESPESLKRKYLSGTVGAGYDPCAAMQVDIGMKAYETKEIVFVFGMAGNLKKVHELVEKFNSVHGAKKSLTDVKKFWQDKLQVIQVKTPDTAMNIMLNGWLIYQTISCRMWARSGFYQAGGALGFRDQLQDCLAIAAIWPQIAKKQILQHARHQFVEGDVLHWWHEPAGKGTRTRISDDYLWLPYVTAEYVRITGDFDILHNRISFLEEDILKDHEDERYCQPKISKEISSLYDHCIRALENGLKFGERGLPLMGGGDWNDGMNTVGIEGKGESVWLGWFLHTTLEMFIPICQEMGEVDRSDRYLALSGRIVNAIEENAWDGNWYKRAFFDNGAPLGSINNRECKIDSIAQAWAVISGAGNDERAARAMDSLEDYLVMRDDGLIKLLTPPFDEGDMEPGYIKGYPPGVRENGGQYTHAAAWIVTAFAMLGDGDKAWELFGMLNPINHTRTDREYATYKVEPYVMAADVYGEHPHIGRGGWTWYTGSAGWVYQAGLEDILGFSKNGDQLTIEPCIPKNWTEYSVIYRYVETTYEINVRNPKSLNQGVFSISVDGENLEDSVIKLSNDKKTHYIEVLMGS
ncbi:GH36-type glycosyl hydrolase domain-containing protein [Candidatus Contubernalis alkaliaceticus]|uniref:GH36-type glycosyl hydrolase domain-containing protein n=1 Tax=Candidatus Contubernalis alkaliaceticus TaxID=338645 RepID=UPI001F4C1794|nr:glucoamylase family protein [Candidatus Contubernalis alkalaceticus]UNC93189.1 glycosyl transferase [Candidatus Contubernalis alkalaceticus]